VGWPTVMRAVVEFGQRILDAAWVERAVTHLGVDETAFLAATARAHTQFVTGVVDLKPAGGGPARLLDVVEGRSGAVVSKCLADRSADWCAGVQVAALDPFRGYDTALRTGLPSARTMLDCFHAVTLAQTAVDTVRRRVQQDTLGHRGRRGEPLYGIRRILLRGAENQTKTSYTRLLAGLAAGDPDDQVATAYIAAQELRHVHGATDLAQARDRLFTVCADAEVPELHRLARTINAWQNQLLAYFHHRQGQQRTHRSGEPSGQTHQAGRVRVPQLHQLPATVIAALRHHLEHSPHNTDQGTLTTHGVVEPNIDYSADPGSYHPFGRREVAG